MAEGAVLASVLTAGVGVLVILASKFKCMYDNGDCKCGCTENPITKTDDITVDKISANGHDFIYISQTLHETSSDSDSDNESNYDVKCY